MSEPHATHISPPAEAELRQLWHYQVELGNEEKDRGGISNVLFFAADATALGDAEVPRKHVYVFQYDRSINEGVY